MGHEKGILLKSYIHAKTDIEIDTTSSAVDWETLYIPFDWTTIAFDIGTIFQRKWITKFHLVGQNHGNMAIQPYALRDLNETGQGALPMAPINYTANITWGKPDCVWGDAAAQWKYDGKMDLWRRFPASVLRSDFMQLKFTAANLAVYASSIDFPEGALAVTDATLKTVTILTPTGYVDIVWPLDVVDYVLAFSYDDYVQEFRIVSVVDDVITVSDPTNLLLAAPSGVEWVIRGLKKEQRVSITSMVVHFAYLGDENQSYPGAASNTGAGNAGENP